MERKKKIKKLTFDEMPILKKAVEEAKKKWLSVEFRRLYGVQ